MSPKESASFVALVVLLGRRFPEVDDPVQMVSGGKVLVDGASVLNPRALVRRDAAIRLVSKRPLRGMLKLSGALDAFGLSVGGLVALDLGAAAGGFTQALLNAGVARVYVVDTGSGQLRGWLRQDARVVNLERTNLAMLDQSLIGEQVDLITMDLSYLSVADAVPQLRGVPLAPGAQMIALIKPTFELHARPLITQPEDVVRAVGAATKALSSEGWQVVASVPSPVRGSKGAVEEFLHPKSPPLHGTLTN